MSSKKALADAGRRKVSLAFGRLLHASIFDRVVLSPKCFDTYKIFTGYAGR